MSKNALIAAVLCLATVGFSAPARVSARQAPETAEQLVSKGWEALNKDDVKLAKQSFERAAKLAKETAGPYVGLAGVARREGRLRDAMKQLDRALKYDPKSADAIFLRGRVFYDRNQIEEARRESARLIEISPRHAGGHILLADINTSGGKYADAVAEFEVARGLFKTGFDDLPNVRERYETLKEYLEFKSHDYWKNPSFVKVQLQKPLPRPEYTELARDNQVSGKMSVIVRFGPDGKVDRVIVLTGLPDGLTRNGIDAVRRIKALPSTLDGKPIASWATVNVGFTIRR